MFSASESLILIAAAALCGCSTASAYTETPHYEKNIFESFADTILAGESPEDLLYEKFGEWDAYANKNQRLLLNFANCASHGGNIRVIDQDDRFLIASCASVLSVARKKNGSWKIFVPVAESL